MTARVKLVVENGEQILRIPQDLSIPAAEVLVSREDGRLLIEPVIVADRASFLAWLKTIEPWDGPGPDMPDPLPEAIDP